MKKGIVGVLLVGTALRIAMLAGVGDAVSAWAKDITADGSLFSATLSLELGDGEETAAEPKVVQNDGEAELGQSSPGDAIETVKLIQVQVTEAPEEEPEKKENQPEIIETTMLSDASIRNDTSFEIDIAALAAEGLDLRLDPEQPQILIIHTHSSEAYMQDEYNQYEESDASRTEDKNYNVIRVGDELTEKLTGYGLNVVHDREIYDYPSYTGSYTRSGESVEAYLAQYPSIKIVIDLHRDAIGTGDTVYKTKAEISGLSSAQVMLLVGTGENGLYHPNWRENLKLALYMQNAMDTLYPTLARPIALKPERYNQQLSNGSMILEVGSSGNTLPESLLAIDLFAEAVGPALAELVETD